MPFNPAEFLSTNRPAEFDRYCEKFYGVATHTRGFNVGRFFKLRRPNEPDEFYNHRILNYQAHLKGAWLRAEDKLSRILSVRFKYESSDYLFDYLNAPRFNNKNLFSWFREFAYRRLLEDANGFITWLPYGEGLINPSVKVDIKPYMIYSIYICDLPKHTKGEYITFCMPEVRYTYGKKNEYTEMEYWAIDREWYYKLYRTGDRGDWVSEPYYRHGLGVLPLIEMPGLQTNANTPYNNLTAQAKFGVNYDPYIYNKKGTSYTLNSQFPFYVDYKESFFIGFIPSANTALTHFADAEAALLSCGYPIRVEEFTPCNERACGTNPAYPGMILGDDGNYHTCHTCGGHGLILPNPLGRYVRRRVPAGMNEKDFVTEPISIIRGVPDEVKILYDNAFDFAKRAENDVWLKDTDKVMSAEQVVAGNDGSKSMVKKIGDSVLNTIQEMMYFAELLTHGSSPIIVPSVEPPLDYNVLDENEMIHNITVLNNSFVSKSVKIKYEKDLARVQANGKDEPVRIIEIKEMWDVFYGQGEVESGQAVMVGGMKPELMQKHIACDAIIARIIARNGIDWIYNADEKIFADMDAEFLAMNLSALITTPIIDPFDINE